MERDGSKYLKAQVVQLDAVTATPLNVVSQRNDAPAKPYIVDPKYMLPTYARLNILSNGTPGKFAAEITVLFPSDKLIYAKFKVIVLLFTCKTKQIICKAFICF